MCQFDAFTLRFNAQITQALALLMKIVKLSNSIDESTAENIQSVFFQAFGTEANPDFLARVNEKRGILVILAYINDELVGFKLGYEKHRGTFFSWLGAVLPSHRRKGVARALLNHQHQQCVLNGYHEIQTEAQGTNAGMLILNLREGFSIFGTHLGHNNEITVQLRKLL